MTLSKTPVRHAARAAALAAALTAVTGATTAQTSTRHPGAVYTTTNASMGNAIAVFTRAVDGTVTFDETVPTGGLGTDGGLGNQGAVSLSDDESLLFAVNAGSDDVSSFRVLEDGLELIAVTPSGGVMPVSVTQRGLLVYVLNAGDDTISGFTLRFDGSLNPLPGSTRVLSGVGVAAAQIEISPSGQYLVVTERATNRLTVFDLLPGGGTGTRYVLPSLGQTPFGFAFGQRGHLLVSEAFGGATGASTLSSFQLGGLGSTPGVITRSVPSNESAACWVQTTPDGRIAYVSNTASDSVSSYAVGFDGALTLLDAQAANTGDRPLDMAVTGCGRFFYVLNAGDGAIGDYVVETDGSLTGIMGSNNSLPTSASGLAAR